jgi:hypothetical protein
MRMKVIKYDTEVTDTRMMKNTYAQDVTEHTSISVMQNKKLTNVGRPV